MVPAPATTGGDATTTTSTTTTPCPAPETTTTTLPAVGGPGTGRGGGGAFGGGAIDGGQAVPADGGSAADATEATFVVTSLAPVGSTIDAGDVVYSTDGVPIIALRGAVPAWRTLSTSSTDGVDVRQLEESLVELGYDTGGDLEVDESFTSATAEAVSAWQEGLGVEATGEVPLGSVVFLAEPADVIAHSTAVGSSIAQGDTVVTLGSPSMQVVADVPESLQSVLAPGAAVTIDTDRAEISGVVAVLRAATDAETGEVGIRAVVVPDEPLDEIPGDSVDVAVTVEGAGGVLTVPSEAVASRLDGSYAVQLVGPDGTSGWVTVEIEGTVGQRTAVRGAGIEAGATILEPA